MSRFVSNPGRWLAIWAAVLMVAGCQCESDPGDRDRAADERAAPDQQGADQDEEIEEIFGLPAPADHNVVRRQDTWIQISLESSLDDVEQLFADHVVDAEVVRTDREVRIVPLRPHTPRAEASYDRGTGSPVVIDYRQPRDGGIPVPPVSEETEEDADDDAEQDREDDRDELAIGEIGVDGGDADSDFQLPDIGQQPDWLEDVQGQPVEITTREGEKLAPGARWGEPYTPPEGSPLHQERFRHNFGRPFGDWR